METSGKPRRVVAIIGPHDADEVLCALARDAGRLVCARLGAVVICGGLTGIMTAAAEGAQSVGGLCIGLLPGRDRLQGNRFLTVAVATGAGQGRNQMIIDSCDVVISVGENDGTNGEIRRAADAQKLVVSIVPPGRTSGRITGGRVYVDSAVSAIEFLEQHHFR